MPSLLPEILDLVLDHLRNDPTSLKACCTVSKRWVSHARAHLFALVEFSRGFSIESWMRVFPDPSNSPAHHTRHLSIEASRTFPTSMDAHAWIHSFCNVVKLEVNTIWYDDSQTSFAPLHAFSPALKSLSLTYSSPPPFEVFNLICSFPSLEDLSLFSFAQNEPEGGWAVPSTSPKLTGTLQFSAHWARIRPDVCRLLDLPGGLHFSCISISCLMEDIQCTRDLVLRCSDTLESLSIGCHSPGVSTAPPPLDLSKATRLKYMNLYWNSQTVQWVTGTLQTANSKYLQGIALSLPFTCPVQATVRQEWEDLDHKLAQLWTTRSIRSKFKDARMTREYRSDVGIKARALLPELASKSILDVVEG